MKLFGKLEKLTRMILTRNASPGTIDSNTTEIYADNSTGKPKAVVDAGGSETTYHLPLADQVTTFTASGSTSLTLPTSGTVGTLAGSENLTNKNLASSTNVLTGATCDSLKHSSSGNTVTLPDVVGTAALIAATQQLTNKDIDGGTASDSLRITIPKNTTTNLNGLTRKEATLVYDTTAAKLKVDNGSTLKVVGGGLIPVELTSASFTTNNYNAASGYHYLVNMEGCLAAQTITLPAAAAEAVIRVTVFNNGTASSTGFTLGVKQNSAETIWYNDVGNTQVNFVYEEGWAEFSYDAGLGSWVVSDGGYPISGTFAGAMLFTGYVTLPGSLRLIGYTTSGSTPSTTELPSSLDACIHRNSGDGKIYLAFNYGGAIKKVELA